MRIGLITSVPLTPPWDQGDKNLAYALATTLSHLHFSALTTRNRPMPDGPNLQLQPVYRTQRPSLVEKAGIYAWMLAGGPKPKPDLYHLIYQPTHWSSHLLRWIPEIRRRPVIHTVPATTEGHRLNPNLFFADRVVAISQYGRRVLERSGIREVVYVPHGIPVARWASVGEGTDSYKRSLELADRLVVLYPGHLASEYGIDQLLEALVDVRQRVPQVIVLLACRSRSKRDVGRRRTLQTMAVAAGIDRSIRWYETVQDMRILIGASDLLVMPFQTMRDKIDIPTTLLEGLAAGKPVIVSDIAPLNEVILHHGATLDDGNVGLLVPPGNASRLSGAMTRLLTNPTERKAMGLRGAGLVRDSFDIGRIGHEYEQIYREVVA